MQKAPTETTLTAEITSDVSATDPVGGTTGGSAVSGFLPVTGAGMALPILVLALALMAIGVGAARWSRRSIGD